MKKVFLSIFSFFLCVLAAETVLRMVYQNKGPEQVELLLKPTLISAENRQLSTPDRLEYDIKRNLTDINFQPKVPHPYFGYTYNRLIGFNVNRDGFFDTIDFESLKKKNNYFIIALFGGSVAKDLANWIKHRQKQGVDKFTSILKKEFPKEFANKKFLFLNFATSAAKQPQQFIISSFYTDKIHMAITLDGYNDINLDFGNEFPLYFPNYSNLFYSLNPARNQYISEVYELLDKQIYAAKKAQNSYLFKHSWIVRQIWSVYNLYIQKKINFMHTKFRDSWDAKHPYTQDLKTTDDIDLHKAVEIWEKFSIKQSRLLSAERLEHFHFIQPNQHINKTKILTLEEQERYFDHGVAKKLNEGYSKLIARLPIIKNETGRDVYDLTQIFSSTTETVYRDSCCHLNKKGNELLEIAIAEKIIFARRQKAKSTAR